MTDDCSTGDALRPWHVTGADTPDARRRARRAWADHRRGCRDPLACLYGPTVARRWRAAWASLADDDDAYQEASSNAAEPGQQTLKL